MPRRPVTVIILLFLAYASFYLCRANVSVAIPLLQREGFDKVQTGQLVSIATVTYAIGKIVLGSTGDYLGGRRLMLLAVTGSVVCSLGFGFQSTLGTLIVFAAANRFFQAGGWSGLVQVVSQTVEPRRNGLVMGILSTSYELGNVLALTLSAFVATHGWRALFVVNPLLFLLVGGSAVLALPRVRAEPGRSPRALDPETADEPPPGLWTTLRSLAVQGGFWTAVGLSALLTFLRDSFNNWTPAFLVELSAASGKNEVSGSIVKSALFPAAGVVAALAVGPIGDRLGRGRRAPIMAVSLTVVVALTLLLAHGPAAVRDPLVAAALIGGIGLFLLGPYSLLAGAMALDVSGKRGAATAAGIIDGAGYLGASLSGIVIGTVAQHRGWGAAFDVVAAVAAVAMAVSAVWSVRVLVSEAKRRG
jgi:sugar phosphate permease